MREILFKAKSVDNGEWIEGFYYFTENPKLQNHHIIDKQGNCYGVIPETVCEYTGLTDRNGKMIWENDICKYFWNSKWYIDVVIFSPPIFTYKNAFRLSLFQDTIIGNIFENPELLEEQ